MDFDPYNFSGGMFVDPVDALLKPKEEKDALPQYYKTRAAHCAT